MTDKDPKDMTASELLRLAANGYDGSSGIVMADLANFMGLGRNARHSESLYKLADKIDAELADAREESLRRGAELWAKANGWPDFREGEDFGAWLDRCAIPLPRFEDGEPVQFGDDADELNGVEKFIFLLSCGGSCQMQDADGNICNVFHGERVKRPAPEALGADGLPVVEGETVRLADEYARYAGIGYHDSGCLCDLAGICANDALKIKRIVSERKVALDTDSDAWCPAKWLTHTPHDTQQQIDDDATMPPAEYCAVRGIDLGDDPDRGAATTTMVRDLLLRQRELDKLTVGE